MPDARPSAAQPPPRAPLAGVRLASPLLATVRQRMAADETWRQVSRTGKWVCPFCLAAVVKRSGHTLENSAALHLDNCRQWSLAQQGKAKPHPLAAIQSRLNYEDFAWRAEHEDAWKVHDAGGAWFCPACLARVAEVRLRGGAGLSQLVLKAMADHLVRCPGYAAGTMHPLEAVVAARARASGAPSDPTSSHGVPVARPPDPSGRTAALPVAPLRRDRSPLAVVVPAATPIVEPPHPPTAEPAPAAPTPAAAVQAAAPATAGDEGNLTWMDELDQGGGGVIKAEGPSTDLIRARALQEKILSDAPEVPGFRFTSRFEACSDITGDFYEFIAFPDGRIGFALGDVSGHGMQAGLIMSMAKKTVEIFAGQGLSPVEMLAKVNDSLAKDLGGKMFVSMMYGVLDPTGGSIRWARAGHTPAIRFNRISGELDEVAPKGMVVGMKSGPGFRQLCEEQVTQVRQGDLFLLYTDGITEAMNPQGEEYGLDNLKELVRRFGPEGPDRLVDTIFERVRHFRGARPVSDDSTLVALATVD